MALQTLLIDVPNASISITTSQSPTASQHKLSPTVVFLHFWGGSSRTWSLVQPIIAATHRTATLDFRGWGRSTGPDDAEAYSIAALAGDVAAVLTQLRLENVVLVGLSMGAKVAQLLAASNTTTAGVLRGLVLVSPAPATPLTLPPEMREQQMRAYDDAESAEFVAKNVLAESFRGGKELPGFVVEDMLRGNRWAREAWPAYAMAEDVSEGVERVAVPVLVLAAEKDVAEPVERVKVEVADRISGARMEVVPGSGHLSPLDAPGAVARHILQFVEALDSHPR